MKTKVISVLVVLVVLASGITACTTKDSLLVRATKIAPINTDIVSCVDIEAMAEDPDLRSWYNNIISDLSYDLLDDIGMNVSSLSAVAVIEANWNSIFLLEGDFNLEDIRDSLEYYDFVESEYLGVEIWTNDLLDYTIAFIGNMIVASDTDSIEASIRRHKNEDSSLYDNEDMKAVVDKLPAATIHVLFGSDAMLDIETLAGGLSIQNEQSNDEVLDVVGWYKYESDANAEAALEDIDDEVEYGFGGTLIDSKLRGQLIEITAEMEIP